MTEQQDRPEWRPRKKRGRKDGGDGEQEQSEQAPSTGGEADAPAPVKRRAASQHAWHGIASGGAAAATTVGGAFGPAGLLTVAAVGAAGGLGAGAVRKWSPERAERMGLKSPDRDKSRDKNGRKNPLGATNNGRGGLGARGGAAGLGGRGAGRGGAAGLGGGSGSGKGLFGRSKGAGAGPGGGGAGKGPLGKLAGRSRNAAGQQPGGDGKRKGLFGRRKGAGGGAGDGSGTGKGKGPLGKIAGLGRKAAGKDGSGVGGKGAGLFGRKGPGSGPGSGKNAGRKPAGLGKPGSGSGSGSGGKGPLGKLAGLGGLGKGSGSGGKGGLFGKGGNKWAKGKNVFDGDEHSVPKNKNKRSGSDKGSWRSRLFGGGRNKRGNKWANGNNVFNGDEHSNPLNRKSPGQSDSNWTSWWLPQSQTKVTKWFETSRGTNPDKSADSWWPNENKTSPQRKSGANGKWRKQGMPNPFQEHNEALSTAAGKVSFGKARDLMDWVDNAPEAARTQAAMWRQHGETMTEEIHHGKGLGEALQLLGKTQQLQVEVLDEAGTTFRKEHAQQIKDIEENNPRKKKWDPTVNN